MLTLCCPGQNSGPGAHPCEEQDRSMGCGTTAWAQIRTPSLPLLLLPPQNPTGVPGRRGSEPHQGPLVSTQQVASINSFHNSLSICLESREKGDFKGDEAVTTGIKSLSAGPLTPQSEPHSYSHELYFKCEEVSLLKRSPGVPTQMSDSNSGVSFH